MARVIDVTAAAAPAERVARRRRGQLDDVLFYAAIAVLTAVVVAAFLAPVLPLPDPNATNVRAQYVRPFDGDFPLGTDSLGRDLLSRALFGARVSIVVAVTAVLSGLVVGGTLGLIAGYWKGWVDTVIMRAMDVILAFPSLIFAIAITAYLGASVRNVIVAIAFFAIPAYARLARATALRLGAEDFVLAAQLMGQRSPVVLWKHYVPNALPSLLTFGIVNLAVAVLIESSLSFLGLGLRPPTPSWGVMISEGRANMMRAPHLVLVPGAFLFGTLLCINLVADRMRSRQAGGRS